MSDHLKQLGTISPQPDHVVGSRIDGVTQKPRPGLHALNVAIIAAVFLAVFWRVIFLGETFIDVRTLDNQLPWGYSAGETSDYPYNRRDLTDTYITRDYFIVASYRDGELPLWNPYTMAGHPIYADGVTRIFSPFLLFYRVFDLPLGYSVARISELFLAAVFMYLFLVYAGAGPAGSLAGSLVFAYSAHSMFHLSGLGWLGGLLWLPLILLAVDRAVTRAGYGWAALAGVFLGAQFYCGWMQNQIYYVGAIGLYYLYFGILDPASVNGSTRSRSMFRTALLAATTLVIGFGLAATQWLPVMELLGYSNRRIVPTEIGYIYLPPWYLATLVFPNLFGSADDARALTLFTALNVSHDHILYIGIAALAPLAYSLYWMKKNWSGSRNELSAVESAIHNRTRFFVILAAISLLIMTAAPLYVHVTRFIPVLQVIRVTVRAGVLFFFALSVLVAFGLKLILESENECLRRFIPLAKKFTVLILTVSAAAVAGSYVLRMYGIIYEDGGSGKLAWLRRAAGLLSEQFAPPRFDIVFPLVLLIALSISLHLYANGRLGRRAFIAALFLLLGVDLIWITSQLNPTFDRSRVFPSTAITEKLRSLPPGRVLVAPSDLETNRRAHSDYVESKIIAPPNTLLPYRIPAVAGKNQQFPRWYREYASLIEPQPYLSHVVFNQSSSRYFDLLNVRYILTHAFREAPSTGDLLLSAEGVSLYENRNAMPRAFLVNTAIEVRDQAEALEALRDPLFDPKSTIVIETGNAGSIDTGKGTGSTAIIEDRRNRVAVECDAQNEAYLVLSDNYYPGWQAYIDGEPAQVIKANCTMRAVRVRAGRHVVSFEFAPATLRLSAIISLFTAALTIAVFAIVGMRRARSGTVRGN